jgi:hypothetical protein
MRVFINEKGRSCKLGSDTIYDGRRSYTYTPFDIPNSNRGQTTIYFQGRINRGLSPIIPSFKQAVNTVRRKLPVYGAIPPSAV